MLQARLQPGSSGVGCNRSANCATNTAQWDMIFVAGQKCTVQNFDFKLGMLLTTHSMSKPA